MEKEGALFLVGEIDLTHDYLLCPFCSWSRLIHARRYEGGVLELREFEIEPSTFNLVQFREPNPGPGRGNKEKGVGGFQAVPEMGMTIQDMLEDPEYRDLGLQLKDRLIQIVRSYMEAGVLNIDELLSDEQTEKAREPRLGIPASQHT